MINPFNKDSQSVQWLLQELIINKIQPPTSLESYTGLVYDLQNDLALYSSESEVDFKSIQDNFDNFLNYALPLLGAGSITAFLDVQLIFDSSFDNTNFSFGSGCLLGYKPGKNSIINVTFEGGVIPEITNPDNQTFSIECRLKRIFNYFI